MTYAIYNNGAYYAPRTEKDKMKGMAIATLASGGIMSGLKLTGKPFQKELLKEQVNNSTYKDYLFEALEKSGLKKEGVEIIPAQNLANQFKEAAEGTNAFYAPQTRQVVLNTEKISHAGFHELGHALNALKSKFGVKYLAKMRGGCYAIAGLMEYFAIFSRTKPKGAKRDFRDFIEDNCGKIAFAALLPVVAEEAIASIRGVKLAKKVGMPEPFVNKLKKLYGKALITYGARAVLGGLAVGASRMIMDYYTRPKKISE